MATGANRQRRPWVIVDYSTIPAVTLTGDEVSWWHQWGTSSLIRGDHKSPNPWSYTVLSQSYASGNYVHVNNGLIYGTVEGQLPGASTFCPPLDLSSDAQACYNDAIGRLNEKVRGSLDLATSLAESGQTWKMLNLTKRLTDLMVDMKRSWKREILNKLRDMKRRRGAGKALRRWQDGLRARHPGSYSPRPNPPGMVAGLVAGNSNLAANGWLEYTYGLRPLLSDIYGVAQNIVGYVHNKCAVKASVTRSIDRVVNVASALYGWQGSIPVKYTGFIKQKFGLLLSPGFDNNLGKWSSLNPLSVAYELMPYSFVIDLVFDLGSYMRNLETGLLYATAFITGYSSQLVRYEANAVVSNTYSSGNSTFTLGASGSMKVVGFGREVLSSYPTPRLPSFDLNLGSGRLLSAAALLRQLLR